MTRSDRYSILVMYTYVTMIFFLTACSIDFEIPVTYPSTGNTSVKPAKLISITTAAANFEAGNTTTLTVKILDEDNNLVTADNSTQITFDPSLSGKITNIETGIGDGFYGNPGEAEAVIVSNGTASLILSDNVAETFEVAITNNSFLLNPENSSITVNPTISLAIAIINPGTDFATDGNTSLTVEIQDIYGNRQISDNSTQIILTPTSNGKIISIQKGTGDGSYGIISGSETVTVSNGLVTVILSNTIAETFSVIINNNSALINPSNDVISVSSPTKATAIASGAFHSCALLTDKTVKCWGRNFEGQLGNGTTIDSLIPVVVTSLTEVTSIASGAFHSCALLTDETVKCWGRNFEGQLGNGTTTNSLTPVAVTSLTGVTAIALGESHSCVLLTDQTVKCWGENSLGQLGNGTTTDSLTPVAVTSLTGVTAIALGASHSCVLLADQTVKCWGYNPLGQLGNGTTTNSLTPVAVTSLTGVSAIALGGYHSCALLADQTVKCWGENSEGQLGNGTTTTTSSPIPVAVTSLTGVAATALGRSHSCALLSDQTVKCWGGNSYGQLGRGILQPLIIPSLTGVIAITAGFQQTCSVLNDNSAKCWGGVAPTAIDSLLTTVATISIGGYHSCALLTDQTVKCWGDNLQNQLCGGGFPFIPFSETPLVISNLTNVINTAAGYFHTCALLADQTVKCWGDSYDFPPFSKPSIPTQVASLVNVLAISAESMKTCVLLTDQTVKCWDGWGSPTTVASLAGVTAIASGGAHSCALLSDKSVRCWGANDKGQLGNGTITNSTSPTAVTSLTDVIAISAGGSHTCALLSDSSVKCWGANDNGQLGNNDFWLPGLVIFL